MRSRWETLHVELLRSLENRRAMLRLEELQERCPQLVPFDRPLEVIAAVAHEGDLDERDRLLRPLAWNATSLSFSMRVMDALG